MLLRVNLDSILDAIAPDPDAHLNGLEEIDEYEETEPPAIIISGPSRPPSAYSNPHFENYHRRLAPLTDLETRLIQQLSDPEDNHDKEATHLPSSQSMAWSSSGGNMNAGPSSSESWSMPKTAFLRSGAALLFFAVVEAFPSFRLPSDRLGIEDIVSARPESLQTLAQ